jgi:hypothetical protein
VNLSRLPNAVPGLCLEGTTIRTEPIAVKTDDGMLRPEAMPNVTIAKYARYLPPGPEVDAEAEVEIIARIQQNLRTAPLSGFVGEGASPYGSMNAATDAALKRAVFSGMPVVGVGRGATGGNAYKTDPVKIAGSNLTSTKARLLLMASLLKLGALPPAADPSNPTPDEVAATAAKVAEYQAIFDTH